MEGALGLYEALVHPSFERNSEDHLVCVPHNHQPCDLDIQEGIRVHTEEPRDVRTDPICPDERNDHHGICFDERKADNRRVAKGFSEG